MDISEIIRTLDKWNFWNQEIETGIKRSLYLDKLNRYLKMPEIIALTGVRRAGKSTIILQVVENLIKEKKVNPQNTLYINFEEPSFENSLDFLVKVFDAYLEFHNPKGKIYLFLDEVQLVKNWERFVVSLYDRKTNIKIFITGSSSKLLKNEISTLLSGRYLAETIYPLSFKEFLNFKKINYHPLIKTPKLYNQLREYLEFGGFPRVVTEKDKHNKRVLLVEYFNSIIERDVTLRHKVRNVKDIKEIISFVFANISKQTSTYKLEKSFNISSQNIRRYFEYFEEAFLLQFAPFFSYSVKKQIYNPQKIFSIDTGLRNAVSFKFSEDIGKLLENLVFTEFLRKKEVPYYWENGAEIDFLLRKGYKVSELFNVCYSINNKATLEREIKSLEKGLLEFKKSKASLIYWEGQPIKHSKIKFINILGFLLNENNLFQRIYD